MIITRLLTMDSPVVAPDGVVFSTHPRRAEGENGVSYFVKGPDIEIVFAEVVGCMLAREAGLSVPDIALCEGDDDEQYAGSAKVDSNLRDALPWVRAPQRVVNFEDLFGAVVVDVWLANNDRNIGGLVARPHHSKGNVELVFLDFEKSVALRPNPRVSSAMLEPRKLWPSGILGEELHQRKRLYPPVVMLNQIRSLAADRCAEIIHGVAAATRIPITWADDSISALSHRASIIQQLAEEVWAVS
jgi:hypothetical protein